MKAARTNSSTCCSTSPGHPMPALVGPADVPKPWFRALVREHLAPSERLCLFRVNKGLAGEVLQQADACTLTLQHQHREETSAEGQAPALSSKVLALQSILAAAVHGTLKVVLHGGWDYAFPPPSPMWPSLPLTQITTLTLYQTQLTQEALISLQLQQCSLLQHVEVDNCSWQISVAEARLMSERWMTWLPPSLTSLRVWARSSPVSLMPWLNENISTLHTSRLTDNALLLLQAFPRLTNVKADRIELEQDHRNLALQWEQLELLGQCYMRDLLLLPVHRIRHLRIQGIPYGANLGDSKVIAHLATCPSLQVVPCGSLSCVNVPYCDTDKDAAPELVALCLASSTVKPCALYLPPTDLMDAESKEYVIGCLHKLPACTTVVLVYMLPEEQCSLEQYIQLWEPVVAALPAHVTHIVLDMEHKRPSVNLASGFLDALQLGTAQTTLQVLLVCLGPKAVGAETHHLLQQLAEAHPGRAVLYTVD